MKPELVQQFSRLVSAENALGNPDDHARYITENRGLFTGTTPLVLKPNSTQEVSAIVRLAAETETALVPQGGHTGHVGGAMPDESNEQIVISMERMNRIREIDLDSNVVVCEAGCILENIQKLADDHDRLFPLALGSQGSCQIGGNIATNAGGTGVLAYGNTRALVMGLEVVLASGETLNGLRRLKKDNTGYCVKELFIGAEGTLGIITAAVLKLCPKPVGQTAAFSGMASIENAVALLSLAQGAAGNKLTAFEFMGNLPVDLTVQQMEGVRNPLETPCRWQVLMEISSGSSQADAENLLQSILETALAENIIADATMATSVQQQKDFWRLRETMPLAQKHAGGSMKHDISIPVHRMAAFLDEANALVLDMVPDARLYTFGHLGDGNVHYNITEPIGANTEAFLSRQPEINEAVYDLVTRYEGSVAAEHGVGQLKRDLLARTKDRVELQLMRTLKRSLDPQNIMNPGKVVTTNC